MTILAGEPATATGINSELGTSTDANFVEAVGGTTTSTSYVAVGATMGTSFVAPPSGVVHIAFGAAWFNSGANDSKTSVRVGTSSTVGGGSTVISAADDYMTAGTTTTGIRGTSFVVVTGLTAGSTYNVQMQHKVGAGTGTFLYRRLSVLAKAA